MLAYFFVYLDELSLWWSILVTLAPHCKGVLRSLPDKVDGRNNVIIA
jgi:hypothetical protein